MQAQRIKSIRRIEATEAIDIEVNHPNHNFYCNGVVTHNSHSVAYGVMAAITIWLKINHPSEFYCALLKMAVNEQDPYAEISRISQELPHFDIKILPPSLAATNQDFAIEGKNIRFGLSAIKGMPQKSLEKIRVFKGDYPTKISMFKAVSEAKIGIAATSALIMAGLLDDFVDSRPRGVLEAQIWNSLTAKEKLAIETLESEYDGDVVNTYRKIYEEKRVDSKGKVYINDKRRETYVKNNKKYIDLYNVNKNNPELASWYFERKLLGFSYTTTLFEVLDKEYEGLIDTQFLNTLDNNENVRVVGIVTEADETKTKKGDKMLKLTIQDNHATVKGIFWGDRFVRWKEAMQAANPKFKMISEDTIIIAEGQKKDDAIFIKDLYLLDEKVFMKTSQIKFAADPEEDVQTPAE